MPFADVAGTRLHYRLDGPEGAPVLVLSNSLGTDLSMWVPQMAAFTRRHRVLRYDARGHGASVVTPAPYGIDTLAGDVIALMDALRIERARFCGLSMGGMVGMWLGIHAADRIERLVLANTAARIGPPETWDARIARVREGGMGIIAQAVIERWFTAAFRESDPAAVASARAMLERTPQEGYVGCCAAVRDMDQREGVAAVRCPTLVIAGSHDMATPPADGRFLAGRIAGARCVELPAAHLSNIECADAFASAAAQFLEEGGR